MSNACFEREFHTPYMVHSSGLHQEQSCCIAMFPAIKGTGGKFLVKAETTHKISEPVGNKKTTGKTAGTST